MGQAIHSSVEGLNNGAGYLFLGRGVNYGAGYLFMIDSWPLGICRDDRDDFEAVVDQKLRLFLIVVNGEQGIVPFNAEDH